LYGYYDGNNLIDGFVVKPHGIYWYNNSIEGGSKLIVNLTDETPNIIHFVYSNGSSNPEKWATTSNESFFKVYLNGVLSYIGNSCPFNTIKDTGKDTESITNINRFKMYVGGIDKGTGKFGNINVYSIEVFKGKLNEVGMVVSEANSKVMTNAVRDPQSATGWNVDFKKQDKELSANFCTKDIETKQISSLVYVSTGDASVDSSNYNFKTLYLGELSSLGPEYEKYSYAPPIDQDSYAQYSYQNEIKSIPFPIMFVDVTENAYWTFEEFTKPVPVASESDLYKNPCTEGKIWFWDPKKRDYAIYTTGVTVAIQGTSTLKDFVKNLNITMPKTDTTETLLFVNDNWIPENTYTLKADIVDSSHSNNASIGQFINTVCGVDDLKQTKGYDFSFDDKAIQNVLDSKEVLNSTIVDSENNPLLPNVTVKHTVEGFPVLLMMRYYGQENQEFKVLGIYSFNLGRDAVRNLGFKKITGLQLAEGETAFHALPAIAEYKVVEAATEPACWIERSTDGDIDLSVITDDSTTIPENINTGAASFWQSAAEIIDYDFETRYSTDKDTQGNYNTPSKHIVFTKFTETLQKLPIEGTIHYAEKLQQADIVGEY